MTIRLPRLGTDPGSPFPPVDQALVEPDGLLAFGGDLHPQRLLNAYRQGIFPWYSQDEPILWWSPARRAVFSTAAFALPRRFRRDLRQCAWTIDADRDFAGVVSACASTPRRGQRGTWITPEMRAAYQELHRQGHAHSVEVRDGDRLIGGIYGVAAAGVFCGESMFSAQSGASKVALSGLCRQLANWGVALLDAQVPNPHLDSLGAQAMPRHEYLEHLAHPAPAAFAVGSWSTRFVKRIASELA
jgi:leucyl/phenylalanyl-tRNA--protein transferase